MKVVYCDMGSDTYNDVLQSDEMVFDAATAPIGTITAWTMKVDASGNSISDIPAGWQRCDGSIIPSLSVWAGQKTPDLNNERRFLRGSSDEDVLAAEEDTVQDHDHGLEDPGHNHIFQDCCGGQEYNEHSSTDNAKVTVTGVNSGYRHGDETRPKNMPIVYIMRVW